MINKTDSQSNKEFNPFLPVPPEMHKKPYVVAVLGNGFDMDLGLNSSYKAFAEAKGVWPFDKTVYQYEGSLSKFLNDKRDSERWFDIEEALAEYAMGDITKKRIHEDKEVFRMLVESLAKYLKKEQEGILKAHSYAAKLLEYCNQVQSYEIYSFNYTDVVKLGQKLSINIEPSRVHYIHGSLANDDIILGTGENKELPKEYAWLFKYSNQKYRSNNIVEQLIEADQVHIFGHSLGENDFDYFLDFFAAACHEQSKKHDPLRKSIVIYTKNEQSRQDILWQLRKLANKHITAMYSHCDVHVVLTNQ